VSFGHLLGVCLEIFFWFQKATLGSRLPLNVSQRPSRPSSVSFGHLLGAFLEIFYWFQKVTLGSRLPLNVLFLLIFGVFRGVASEGRGRASP
jgi:hypothetical protein